MNYKVILVAINLILLPTHSDAQTKKEQISDLQEQLAVAYSRLSQLEKSYDSIVMVADNKFRLMKNQFDKLRDKSITDSIAWHEMQLRELKLMQKHEAIIHDLNAAYILMDSLRFNFIRSSRKIPFDKIDPIPVFGGYAIFTDHYDSSWLSNQYEFLDDGIVRCLIDIEKIPSYLKRYLKKIYYASSDGNISDLVSINKLYVLANYVPHFGEIQFWDPDYTSKIENPNMDSINVKAEYFFNNASSSGRYLVGELNSRNSQKIIYDFILDTTDFEFGVCKFKKLQENITHIPIKKEIINIFENSLATFLKEDYSICSDPKYQQWSKNPKNVQLWNYFDAGNGEIYVSLSIKILDELSATCVSSSSLWLCRRGSKPKYLWNVDGFVTFESISDLDNNDSPEFVIDTGEYSPNLYFLKKEALDGWIKIPLYSIPYSDCPF